MIHIKAPEGNKIRDTRTGKLYAEVICEERLRDKFVLADSEDDPTIETMEGITLENRVSDLEDAVVELAEIITEEG